MVVRESRPTVRASLILPFVVLLAGCSAIYVTAPEPVASYTGEGPPPTPESPRIGTRERDHGGCIMDTAFAFARAGSLFRLPLEPSFASEHAENWTSSKVTIEVEADREVSIPGRPILHEGALAFTLDRKDDDFATILTPGNYVAWSLRVNVTSSDPDLSRLEPLGKPELRGWLLVTRGSDDKIWVYLEGERLVEDPFPVARLLGGDLFVSGRGVCP